MKQWFADITFLFVFSVVVIVRGMMHIIWAVAILPAGLVMPGTARRAIEGALDRQRLGWLLRK